jgi:predicted DNA-binding WGR domain protein
MNKDSIFLGRYELTSASHNKFWECLYFSEDQCLVRWGKIGAKKPGRGVFDNWVCQERAREKLKKGYVYISGSHKSLEAIHEAALEESVLKPSVAVAPGRSRL